MSEESGNEAGRIAIIGMAGRFPGAKNIEQFWRNLRDGVESITRFSDAELQDWFDAETRSSPDYVKARPILDDVELFDADFFGMYAREAELTDPQHRVFLEICWEALEDAGYDPARYPGAIGVFAGCSMNTYLLNNLFGDRKIVEEFTSDFQVGHYPMLVGAGREFLATRVSYKLDLRGPSATVQTACSTSLFAVAQACQSLVLYQADMILAGGVSITFPQQRGYLHQEGGMVSADGSVRAFDAAASGTVFGSGAGVVLLKRLEDAQADGDHIYAVIRGCGVTNDGASKVGFTAPSVDMQAAAIEMALANADIEARSVSYVECHGTGTPLGDPIEIAGLTKAFQAETGDTQFCAIGSLKTNIGHLDAASGVAGLIKTALALKHRELPATLHFREPNPLIDFPASPFQVNASLTEWREGPTPRRAGVSSLGVGGTNVHVILEEAPEPVSANADSDEPQLIVVSARSGEALATARANLARYLREHPEQALGDIAYTSQVGRRAFDHRAAYVCRDRDQAVAKLEAAPAGRKAGEKPTVCFMFPGQGAQYPDMGRDLYEHEPEFRDQIDRCAAILTPLMGEDIRKLLYPSGDREEAGKRLLSTLAAQPAIFVVEYALAKLWIGRGIVPDAMIGHSVGEFVAACLAGVFSLEDALAIVAARGRMMRDLPGGAMLAVRWPAAEIEPDLDPAISIAAINGPSLCVISGPTDRVEMAEKQFEARGVISRRLHTSHAFHSQMMDPIVAPLRDLVAGIALSPPTLPCISCVTGLWLSDEDATSPDYWARHAREPVRFADGVATVIADGMPILIEAGPGNALSTLARQITRGRDGVVVGSLPDSTRAIGDGEAMLEALAQVWAAGITPDWAALHQQPRARVSLPTYAFERSRHWVDPPAHAAASASIPIPPPALSPSQDKGAMNHIPASPAPANETPPDQTGEARGIIVALLEELSGEKLGALAPETSFLEMGFDSLFLTQVAQKLQGRFKVKITFRQLLGDYATVPALAGFLAEKMPASPAKAAAVAAPAPVARATPAHTPAPPAAARAGIEGIMRDQLDALSSLINRQLETLAGMGIESGATAPVTPEPVAAQTPTPAAAPVPAAADEAMQGSRFQVYQTVKKSSDSEITPGQQRHIDDLIARYTAKTHGSKQMTETYRRVLADPRAASGFRSEWKEMVYPIVAARSSGSKIWDVDDNEYIDLVNGYGQTAFGHAPDFVVDAVKAQLDKGFAIGPQGDLAGEVATLIAELTGNERVTFCNTGSEAVMAALRVARAVTGRERVVVFNGAYHGQFDEVLVKGAKRAAGSEPRSLPVAAGIPASSVENMVVLEYATPDSLDWIRANAEDLAAVVVEPVQSRHPSLLPTDFLRAIREITEESGTAFIIDEVVTGFRVHPGGIQAVTGIRADMATYGKVVGGGLPVGILAGKARFMDALDGGMWQYGDDSIPEVGVTFFAGTFVRHPLVLAAIHAVLTHLKSHGPALQETLAERTALLAARLNDLFEEFGLTTRVEHYSSFFYFNIHNEHRLSGLLFYHLRLRGLHVQDGFPLFLTTRHSDADIEAIHEAFRDSIIALNEAGILGTVIEPPPEDGLDLPLTESQTEIWLAAQLGDNASCAFNESVALRLTGTLDETALRAGLDAVIARHDGLRLRLGPTGETMAVMGALSLSCPSHDFSAGPDPEAALAALVGQDAKTAFDLEDGPLIRAHLVRLSPVSHVLILTAHHIICDGWSFNVIIGELAEFYASRIEKRAADLPNPLSFAAYAHSLRDQNETERAETETFWLKQFAEPAPLLDLPLDRPRPAMKSYNGATRSAQIEAPLTKAVKTAGARERCTLFATLLAAFQALIGRLAGQEDIVVGVPTAGQSLVEDEILVGHCVNFLPLRARWSAGTKFSEHMARVAKQVLEAQEHQNTTLGTVVRMLEHPRTPNRVPLAEIQFNLERLADKMGLPGLELAAAPNPKAFVNFDLFLNVIESSDGLRLDCDYNTDLFDAATIDLWLACYRTLLESLVADAAMPVSRISYIPAAELARLLPGLEVAAHSYPRESCIHHLFEAQARAAPHAIAIRFAERDVSYGELDRRANQLAHHLRARLGGAGELVGLLVERSDTMLVALLAILKAGYAYVPLDPTHPPARLRHILTEAKVAALVTEGGGEVPDLPAGTPVIALVLDHEEIDAQLVTSPDIARSAEAAAYVIYTSGSTGAPKGVEISHRSVVNLLTSMAREPGLEAKDTLLAVTTISFDIAGLELFLPLIVGARVVIATRDETHDGYKLLDRLKRENATMMQATPTSWRLLLAAGFVAPPGFTMLCGGEALPRELADQLLAGSGSLWNMYGPTETTIWSSCTHIEPGAGPVTVGRPIANTRFYILDRNDQPVPGGVAGHLHIGGDGVALGYFGRPDLTAERFIADPFHPEGGRIYRTGDLARLMPNGEFQILGRIDQQIKLRGFRVELGEVEAVMLESAGLAGAAASVQPDGVGGQRLVGYYVEQPGHSHTPGDLRALLAQSLPDYMIPAAWVRLDALPVSPNGKLDRAALPSADQAVVATADYVAPESSVERSLAAIWAQVLGLDQVGMQDDLFDLGADSIHIFQITARANREGIKLAAKQLISFRTIAALAPELSRVENDAPPAGSRPAKSSLADFVRARAKSRVES